MQWGIHIYRLERAGCENYKKLVKRFKNTFYQTRWKHRELPKFTWRNQGRRQWGGPMVPGPPICNLCPPNWKFQIEDRLNTLARRVAFGLANFHRRFGDGTFHGCLEQPNDLLGFPETKPQAPVGLCSPRRRNCVKQLKWAVESSVTPTARKCNLQVNSRGKGAVWSRCVEARHWKCIGEINRRLISAIATF